MNKAEDPIASLVWNFLEFSAELLVGQEAVHPRLRCLVT